MRLLLIGLAICVLAGYAESEIYKYRDQNGRLVISNTPPPKGESAEESPESLTNDPNLAPIPQPDNSTILPLIKPSESSKPKSCISIISTDTKILEQNSVYVTWGWKARVSNKCRRTLSLAVKITFLSHDGYELDNDYARATIGWHSAENITGRALIRNGIAKDVARYVVTVAER